MVAVVIIMKAVMKCMWSSVIHCSGSFVSCYLKPALACALSDVCCRLQVFYNPSIFLGVVFRVTGIKNHLVIPDSALQAKALL